MWACRERARGGEWDWINQNALRNPPRKTVSDAFTRRVWAVIIGYSNTGSRGQAPNNTVMSSKGDGGVSHQPQTRGRHGGILMKYLHIRKSSTWAFFSAGESNPARRRLNKFIWNPDHAWKYQSQLFNLKHVWGMFSVLLVEIQSDGLEKHWGADIKWRSKDKKCFL